jgi:hypothetical protein
MHSLRRRRGVRGGFMHVPSLAVLPLHEQLRGVQIALHTALEDVAGSGDAPISGGAIA